MKSRMAMLEDDELIGLTLAGQTECFNVLIDRHKSSVRTRIRAMAPNTAHEDDLVQQAFLKAWRHLASFRFESSFRSWITRIAINEVIQLYRRECHSPVFPATRELDTFASNFESPQQSFERTETAQTIRSAIAGLPATYKQILILHYFEELSEAEAARWLHGSIAMVKSRLFRARQMLLAALQRQSQQVSQMPKRTGANARMASQVDPISKAA
jgi:RNA polymerase sigma-70 factor (ECF subfamily)